MNITDRFINNASDFCPIIDYWPYKFVDAPTGLEIMPRDFDHNAVAYAKKDLSDKYTGWLELFKQNNPYSVYGYINVTNGYVYLQQPDPLILITLVEPYREPPNYPPFFEEGGLDNLRVNVTYLNQLNMNVREIVLPPVQDSYATEKHQIWIEDMPPYMTMDPYKRIIYIDANRFPRDQLGVQSFELTLSDKGGLSSSYILNIDFYEYEYVPDEDNGGGLVKKERDYGYGDGKNVSAYIHSISIYGEMEIRFNASMFTEFNHSWLNESFVDMYMIPTDPDDGYNISRWNFTWNVTSYKDNVLKIQLNFTDRTAIS